MKYFIKVDNFPEKEVSKEEYIKWERHCGFRSKFGSDSIATAGFGSTSNGTTISGRIVYD